MTIEKILDSAILVSKTCFKYYYSLYILFLIFVLLMLSLVGGLVFQIVEAPPETKIFEAILRQRESTIRQLRVKIQAGESKAEVTLFIQLYEGQYIGAIRNGTVILNGKEDPLWTYEGSVYYCVTTFSLVGYGNLAPKTNLGRAIAIIYCGFTVPVTSLILGELGELLLLIFDVLWSRMFSRIFRWQKETKADPPKNRNNANINVLADYEVNIKCLHRVENDTLCESIYSKWLLCSADERDDVKGQEQNKLISCARSKRLSDYMTVDVSDPLTFCHLDAAEDFDMPVNTCQETVRNCDYVISGNSSLRNVQVENECFKLIFAAGLLNSTDSKISTDRTNVLYVQPVTRNIYRCDRRVDKLKLQGHVNVFWFGHQISMRSVSHRLHTQPSNGGGLTKMVQNCAPFHRYPPTAYQHVVLQSHIVDSGNNMFLNLAFLQRMKCVFHTQDMFVVHFSAGSDKIQNYIGVAIFSQHMLGSRIFILVIEVIYMFKYGNRDIDRVFIFFVQYKVMRAIEISHTGDIFSISTGLLCSVAASSDVFSDLRIVSEHTVSVTLPVSETGHELVSNMIHDNESPDRPSTPTIEESPVCDIGQGDTVPASNYRNFACASHKNTVMASIKNTNMLLWHVKAEGKPVVGVKCCKERFSCIVTVLCMVFQKRVSVPDPVTLFWLGTPLRCIYIGKRIGDAIRMHLKRFSAESASPSKGKVIPSRDLLATSMQHGQNSRDRNNNVSSKEYFDDDDDDESDDDYSDDEDEDEEDEDKNEEDDFKRGSSEPVLLTIATTFAYISIGSAFLTKASQNLSYFDSFWFIFISVVTIGYGDVVPTDKTIFILLLGYIFLGLCLMSNLIGETSIFFSANVGKAKAIVSDGVAIVHTKKQLILLQRRSQNAKNHWAIVRERVISQTIPRHLIEESTKYKAELLTEERELVRWAYKVYFKSDKPNISLANAEEGTQKGAPTKGQAKNKLNMLEKVQGKFRDMQTKLKNSPEGKTIQASKQKQNVDKQEII